MKNRRHACFFQILLAGFLAMPAATACAQQDGTLVPPILRESDIHNKLESGKSTSHCYSEWKKCADKCAEIFDLDNKNNCLDDCAYQKEQCSRPY